MRPYINIQAIMQDFAISSGLSDLSKEPRRYLWTDAFSVFNYLELYRQTGEQTFLELALKLVDQVHNILGKHRKDSQCTGWLSGFDEKKAQEHPTCGGLRIGKKLNERQPEEPFDEALEWDQDGQYFHYLTKWMHALNCVSHVTGKPIYNKWAIELAKAAHAAFIHTPIPGEKPRIYWKMSIDLSRPLVHSMGHHDPLDGLITYQTLDAAAKRFSSELRLQNEIEDMRIICEEGKWSTGDALGIGGLLTDALKLIQLIEAHACQEADRLDRLLQDIELSLKTLFEYNQLNLPAEYRLGFRELGLSIGLHAVNKMQNSLKKHATHFSNADQLAIILARLSQFYPLCESIENFWSETEHQLVKSWLEHKDINDVMLVTSLAPESYLSCG
jgi:hypothetical protein